MGFTCSLFVGLLEQRCHFKLKYNFFFQKIFHSDEEWHIFYFDSTISGWVSQDFDLYICKLHDCDVDTKIM